MLIDLPGVIRSVTRFRLCVHTLCVEIATWNSTSSPTCDLCEADINIHDEKHVLFHCTHPRPDGFSPQIVRVLNFTEDRMCQLFYTRKTTNSFFSFMNLFYFTNRQAVLLLD